MKCLKVIAFTLSALLISGCAKEGSAKLSANAENSTVSTSNPIEAEETSTYFESDTVTSEENAEETSRIFERVSHLHLSEAEQIYTSIYNMVDFTHYLYFRIAEDIDRNDVIYIERLNTPIAGLANKEIGKSTPVAYYRIADGRASNGIDLAEWIDSFVSARYIACEYSQFIDESFIVSENKIYVNQYLVFNSLGWTDTSDLKLNNITVLDENTIELDFSYMDNGLDSDTYDDVPASFSITMSNRHNGWKIDSTNPKNPFYTALIRDFFFNEQESDLLTQIENYLSENPIS